MMFNSICLLCRPALIKSVKSCSRRCLQTKVEFTHIKHPDVKRKPFSKIQDSDLKYFESVLGKNHVLTNEAEVESYNVDWMNTCKGMSTLVLKPKTTEEVSKLLSHCNDRNLAVCPQGGNTGLVGGSVPIFDEVIISTSRMNEIISFDPLTGIIECQAGCILENLEKFASEHSYTVPLDLGAKGSCQIGGNVSTNAGGIRVIRYGTLHNNVLGVEMVKSNGEILSCLSKVKKDNTGYDIKRIMIGSEGTLGIITKISLQFVIRPKFQNVAFMGCNDMETVFKLFSRGKHQLGEILSAYEVMDSSSMDCVTNTLKLKNPISDCNFYVLIETSGSNANHDQDKLDSFLTSVSEDNLILDGLMTTSETQMKNIWQLRERIAEGVVQEGYCYKYDVSIPSTLFYKPVELMRDRLKNKVSRICGYGHLGDGNLHLNMVTKAYDKEVMDKTQPFLFEQLKDMKGSISAEHGLGFHKGKYIHYSKPQNAVDIMLRIKEIFDPKGIMNPYKMFPYE